MTGATVIIIKGNRICLGEVRHTGMDVMDFFIPANIATVATPKELWNNYLNDRRKSFSDISLASEITETDFDKGVCFQHSIKGLSLGKVFDQLLKAGHSFIEETSSQECDGYLCGYSDYCLLISLDDQTITKID